MGTAKSGRRAWSHVEADGETEACRRETTQDGHHSYMVVIPVTDHEPDAVKLYVLVQLKGGLCTPYSIGQEDVFYLRQYRDNTTTKDRGLAWNQLVW